MDSGISLMNAAVLVFRVFLIFLIPIAFLIIKTWKDPRIVEKFKSFNGPVSLPFFGCSLRLFNIGGLSGKKKHSQKQLYNIPLVIVA
jgi:hypothetical protein